MSSMQVSLYIIAKNLILRLIMFTYHIPYSELCDYIKAVYYFYFSYVLDIYKLVKTWFVKDDTEELKWTTQSSNFNPTKHGMQTVS